MRTAQQNLRNRDPERARSTCRRSYWKNPKKSRAQQKARREKRRLALQSAVMAVCRKCGQEKPRTAEFFRTNGGKLACVCKECRWYDWKRPRPVKALRRCQWCHEDKPREGFIADCCSAECNAASLTKLRDWSLRYPERTRERSRAYSAKLRSENKELANARCRESYRRHPERLKATSHVARAKRKAVPGHFTATDLRRLYEEQSGCCYYCEIGLGGKYHVDHKLPIARGGTNDPTNLALACARCNLRKNTLTAEEFIARITAFDFGYNTL